MADILKVTAPAVGKNVITPNKATQDPSIPFELSQLNPVLKNGESSSLLGQYNVFRNETGAATLMDLITNPDVTVNYLKNIYMLEEIIKLLPVNNQTVTEEIQQLFQALLIKPDQIVDELLRQEYSSTLFKGELFDQLRELLKQSPGLKKEIAALLKSINGTLARRDVMDSVANSLEFLSENMRGSSVLSAKLSHLAGQLRKPSNMEYFQDMKQDILNVLREVESSILYTPQIAKVLPMIIYNLSRFQDNPSFLNEALLNVLIHVNGRENKEHLKSLVFKYIESFSDGARSENRSRIMNLLADIISKQDQETDMSSLNGDKIEKIITSLLSSPCNYTPLLHFVIPVVDAGVNLFSEIWVDPNETETSRGGGEEKRSIHMLITFDITGIGQFEAEIFVQEKEMRLTLLCPENYVSQYAVLADVFRETVGEYGFRLVDVNIDQMEGIRSLMDVFKDLPYRRTGVDVRI